MQRNNRKNMIYSFYIKLKSVKMFLEEGIWSTTIAKVVNLKIWLRTVIKDSIINQIYIFLLYFKNLEPRLLELYKVFF